MATPVSQTSTELTLTLAHVGQRVELVTTNASSDIYVWVGTTNEAWVEGQSIELVHLNASMVPTNRKIFALPWSVGVTITQVGTRNFLYSGETMVLTFKGGSTWALKIVSSEIRPELLGNMMLSSPFVAGDGLKYDGNKWANVQTFDQLSSATVVGGQALASTSNGYPTYTPTATSTAILATDAIGDGKYRALTLSNVMPRKNFTGTSWLMGTATSETAFYGAVSIDIASDVDAVDFLISVELDIKPTYLGFPTNGGSSKKNVTVNFQIWNDGRPSPNMMTGVGGWTTTEAVNLNEGKYTEISCTKKVMQIDPSSSYVARFTGSTMVTIPRKVNSEGFDLPCAITWSVDSDDIPFSDGSATSPTGQQWSTVTGGRVQAVQIGTGTRTLATIPTPSYPTAPGDAVPPTLTASYAAPIANVSVALTDAVKWYAFNIPAGRSVDINTFGALSTDTMIALYDGAGNFLAFNDDAGSTQSQILYTTTATDTYYVVVSWFQSHTTGNGWRFDVPSGSTSPGNTQLTVTF